MKLTYRDYLEGTLDILKKSQKEKKEYKISFLGRDFVVYRNVFSPKYFNDSLFFIENMPIIDGEEFLEIGPGTGVISIFAALKGASRVVSIDINPDAVRNTKENAKLNGVDDKVTVYEGDVYSPLADDERFDTIFWNTPFGYVETNDISILEKSIQDPMYKSTKKFVFNSKKHLKRGGRLLIGFSNTLGKFEILESFLNEAGFEIKVLSKIASKEKYPVEFEIYEATPK